MDKPGTGTAESTKVMACYLRDVIKNNEAQANFRLFGPDETDSNRLMAVFEATPRTWEEPIYSYDEYLAPRAG